MPHNKGGTGVRNEFLTSTAWNALIHHPVEDSDTEELPSTVDMDAIKGAPGTPITGQVVHWNSLGDSNSKSKIEESDDSSSDEEEKDSDSNSRSSSDSESDVSNFFYFHFNKMWTAEPPIFYLLITLLSFNSKKN